MKTHGACNEGEQECDVIYSFDVGCCCAVPKPTIGLSMTKHAVDVSHGNKQTEGPHITQITFIRGVSLDDPCLCLIVYRIACV